MAKPTELCTATVVFEYAWEVNMVSKQTLRYTTTYTNTPGPQNLYQVVKNSELPSPSQLETVGIHLTLRPPGGLYTHTHLATVATHRPTRPVKTGAITATSSTRPEALGETLATEPQWSTRMTPSSNFSGVILAALVIAVAIRFLYSFRASISGVRHGIRANERKSPR